MATQKSKLDRRLDIWKLNWTGPESVSSCHPVAPIHSMLIFYFILSYIRKTPTSVKCKPKNEKDQKVSRGRIFSDHTCHVYLKSINVPDHFAISSAHSSCACTVGLNFVGPVPLSEIRGLRLDAVDLYVLQFFFFPHFQNLQFCKVIYSWRH